MPSRRGFTMIVCALTLDWMSPPSSMQAQAASAKPVGKHFDQVVIVMMENAGTDQALADAYISSLSRKAAWFSHYYAITHPSFPNYLAIVAGSTFGLDSDHRPPPLKGATIVDRLEEKNLTWKSYAEDYPGGCFLGSAAGAGRLTPTAAPTELYARKHVPLLAFASIQNDPARCAHVVGAGQFMRDARAGKLPNYSFYTPNMFNDGHDTSLGASSNWLKGFIGSLESTLAMHQRTLLVITWDEGGNRDNRVLTLLLGPVMNPGKYPATLTHYSLLRTIEENFGLSTVGAGDKKASPFPEDLWR
ncbi:MAG TPA: alkaline phosphatase family protein [Gemmatimonadaceae bacterium]|nr:alkaline phosphatase family protein [Gemmatimonadaceae bacterium]